MAALTPISVTTESAGSLTLVIAKFSAIASGDTYASGLGNTVVFTQGQLSSAPSTTANPFSFEAVNSSGTFTFYTGDGGTTKSGTLLAYVRG